MASTTSSTISVTATSTESSNLHHHHQHSHHSDHHVHFDQTIKDGFEEDNIITYQRASSGDSIIIHLGFLQINHRYAIDLKLPCNLLHSHSAILITDEKTIPNLNCKLLDFKEKHSDIAEFYEMKIEFFAHKEKLLKEELRLFNMKNSEEKIKLIFNARVLGRGKGTPMLRNGVHCIGVEADEESGSDWQGFVKHQHKTDDEEK